MFAYGVCVLEVFFPGAVGEVGEFVFEPEFEVECVNVVPCFFEESAGYG